MNKLREHLNQARISQVAFADLIGVRQATVSRLCSGEQVPSLDLAVRIERETQGAVPATSWVPEPTEAPAPTTETPNEDAA